MIEKHDIEKIKETSAEFLQKMAIPVLSITVQEFSLEDNVFDEIDNAKEKREVVDVGVFLEEPQILIGQGGQTLFELQRLLKIILNKRLTKTFYINVDINDYKKKKQEYLKSFANEVADQVFSTKEEKVLAPMPAYERRILHKVLAKRADVTSESRGEGQARFVVIKIK